MVDGAPPCERGGLELGRPRLSEWREGVGESAVWTTVEEWGPGVGPVGGGDGRTIEAVLICKGGR